VRRAWVVAAPWFGAACAAVARQPRALAIARRLRHGQEPATAAGGRAGKLLTVYAQVAGD